MEKNLPKNMNRYSMARCLQDILVRILGVWLLNNGDKLCSFTYQ